MVDYQYVDEEYNAEIAALQHFLGDYYPFYPRGLFPPLPVIRESLKGMQKVQPSPIP